MRKNVRGRVAALVVSAALLVPLIVIGGPAFAGGSAPAAQYQYKVVVCHPTGSKKHPFRTIRVARKAVASAIKGGGHVGRCTGNEKPKPKKHQGKKRHGRP